MNISSDFFLIDQINQEKEEEDLRILNNINHRKKPNSKYKIVKYEKFLPKPKIEIGKIDSTILTAENKVKLLLSTFLRDLRSEQKKEKYSNSNSNTKLKSKKTKIPKKKVTAPNVKISPSIINVETPVFKIKKIKTVSIKKYYKNDKNNFNQLPPSFKKRTNSANSKSLFENSYHTFKDNLSNLKKNYQKKFFPVILSNSNTEKSEITNRINNVDLLFHQNVVTKMKDIEKNYCKHKLNSAKQIKKYKKNKTKIKRSSKKSIKSVKNNSLYLNFNLSNIIEAKLLKLTGDIREGMAIEEMIKESKNRRSATNNYNLSHYYNYFNNSKNSNSNYCSNFSDKAKSESNTPKKDFFINNINKMEKTENINDSLKSISSNGKGTLNEYIQRAKSYFSAKAFPVNSINKKYIKINTLKDLKKQIRNTIILRPEELNLTVFSNANNNQNKSILSDKEKSQRSKIYISSENKNSESNLLNNKQNIDKRLNKSKLENEDETGNNEIIKNLNNYSDNESQKKNKKLIYSIGKFKTNKEIINENFRVFTYKKLVYDSYDDEEAEEEYNNKYIRPDSLFIRIFDNIVSFLAFSTFIYIPYYLASTKSFCKNYKKPDYVIILFVEIAYFLDLIFGFFKAFYNFEEQLITNNIVIIKKYFFSWFLLDFISALPIYSYLRMIEPLCLNYNNINPYDEIIYNFHYLIILNKLFKIFKVNFINHNFIHISNKLGLNSTLLTQLLILLSGLHFFSCLGVFIGRNSYPNWILESKLENKNFLDLYISSIYSIVTSITTVGYGDIVCHSFPERIFQIFLFIIGSIAYSWLVSTISNYIKKNNEKSIDFENRKQILDEIRYNYPIMSNDLYQKILLYLKYKNCNEKRDKNMIFECLPIGLKNNLVYEMYRPIIKNFIFFKNFDNSDFIIRVILAFKPILAYKNDILLNEGDIVNDILFVKKGILSVQIPINIKNPEEYINKYLYGDILEQKNQTSNFLNSGKQNTGFMTSIIFQQEYNPSSFLNLTEKEDLYNKIKKKEEENERKKNIRYIKILSIRQNEHFGDVLIFLDQRSPLRVKVISKKAELFFLKKWML